MTFFANRRKAYFPYFQGRDKNPLVSNEFVTSFFLCRCRHRRYAAVKRSMGFRPYWPALVLSLVPAACLAWGFLTGRMPQGYGTFDRQANPGGFWSMAVIWAVLLAILLWINLRL